jgi:hypothetical protein
MLKGVFLGAALMFLLIACYLAVLFHPFGQEHAIGEGAIVAATIWSPLFRGVGVGVVVPGVIGMNLLR